MSTDLVVREPHQVTLSSDQLSYIAGTEFVPPGLRGNLPAILACVAMGRELGIGDMVALKSIHIIDGKATFSAELMVQLVRKRGHSITGDVGPATATVTGTRADNGDTMTCTWTLEMADRAGLANKGNWKKYPEAMLWARAASQLCRMLFADCFAGNTYTPEELGDDTSSAGEPSGDASPSQADSEPFPPASPADDPADGTPFQYGDGPVQPPGADADKKPTKKQIDALNALVGQLRAAGHITTLQLWQSMGREPKPSLEDHELHWSPLRDSLTRAEAHQLLDRLIPFANEKLLPLDAA